MMNRKAWNKFHKHNKFGDIIRVLANRRSGKTSNIINEMMRLVWCKWRAH